MHGHRDRPCRRAQRAAAAIGAALAAGCGSPEQVLLGTGLAPPSVEAGAPPISDAGGESSAPDGGRVLGFMLVDVTTGTDVRQLSDGDTIVTTAAPVTLRALVALPNPGSMAFLVDGSTVRIQHDAPFAIAGNTPTMYLPWHIAAGTHRVEAVPYSGPSGTGVPGIALQQTFVSQ